MYTKRVYVLSKYEWNMLRLTGRGLYALFSNSFFLFDQSGYQKHAGGFLWLFNASLYGLICTKP